MLGLYLEYKNGLNTTTNKFGTGVLCTLGSKLYGKLSNDASLLMIKMIRNYKFA